MIGSCQQVQGYNTTANYQFEWSHPQGQKSVCYKRVATNNHYINISSSHFKYELIALNPTGLDNGTYYGEVTYTVGDGQQVDLGHADYGGNRSLTIKIAATVKNEFQVRFPAGSERAALEPAGGWQSWLQQGSVPAKLSRDLGFSLSSSARFSMHLFCQYYSGGGCALRRDNGGGEVPIQVAVSMPGVHSSQGGAPASRYPLGMSRREFQPSGQVSTSAAQLHFEMQRSDMAAIVRQPGARYRGDVTVVFDASL
ncbi:hypothetical protein BI344_14710 [Chromobacterium sphagni]|uniref:Uncharacterized protein n=2 Tax=Chromobacterium sphagni TaxID=1903179 RepID=A0ABX3CEC7_9NEIS|nr:hypothetical protein BI344_14710 [Chromobacterium sphagni]